MLIRIIPFAVIGAAVGVPLSYQIQNDLVRGMVSRRDYTARVFTVAPNAIWDEIRAEGGSADPLGIIERLTFTVLLCGGAGAFFGLWVTSGR